MNDCKTSRSMGTWKRHSSFTFGLLQSSMCQVGQWLVLHHTGDWLLSSSPLHHSNCTKAEVGDVFWNNNWKIGVVRHNCGILEIVAICLILPNVWILWQGAACQWTKTADICGKRSLNEPEPGADTQHMWFLNPLLLPTRHQLIILMHLSSTGSHEVRHDNLEGWWQEQHGSRADGNSAVMQTIVWFSSSFFSQSLSSIGFIFFGEPGHDIMMGCWLSNANLTAQQRDGQLSNANTCNWWTKEWPAH